MASATVSVRMGYLAGLQNFKLAQTCLAVIELYNLIFCIQAFERRIDLRHNCRTFNQMDPYEAKLGLHFAGIRTHRGRYFTSLLFPFLYSSVTPDRFRRLSAA